MTIYTVLAPAVRDGEAVPDPMRTVFVKEGWCWPALFIPLVWLLFRRMWLVALAYVVVVCALAYLDMRLDGPVIGIAILVPNIYLFLEGNELRRWTLAKRGFSFTGVVEGRNREEAEIRYFVDAAPPVAVAVAAPAPLSDLPPEAPPAPEPPVLPTPPTPPAPPATIRPAAITTASVEKGDIVGLFPAPQRST